MSAGVPLSDADRAPWLESVRDAIRGRLDGGEDVAVRCSALRLGYQDVLRATDREDEPGRYAACKVRFVCLRASSKSKSKKSAAAEGGDGRGYRHHREPAAAEEEKRRPAAFGGDYCSGTDGEESEDEEQHFKRRPSSSSRRGREREQDAPEEQPRHSRRFRDHNHVFVLLALRWWRSHGKVTG